MNYITPPLLKSIWVGSLLLSIASMAFAIMQVTQSPLSDQAKAASIVVCFVAALVGLTWARITLETAAATFEIRDMLRKKK